MVVCHQEGTKGDPRETIIVRKMRCGCCCPENGVSREVLSPVKTVSGHRASTVQEKVSRECEMEDETYESCAIMGSTCPRTSRMSQTILTTR